MQTFKRIMAFFLYMMISSSIAPAFAETVDTKDMHHARDSLDWPGIYYGFLPCADCKGVKSTLALNKNGSYMLISQYAGKSEREFVEKGKFTWDDKNNNIVLTPRNNATARYYFVGENRLIQLDDKGNRIAGNLAERYVLRRTDMAEPVNSHSSH